MEKKGTGQKTAIIVSVITVTALAMALVFVFAILPLIKKDDLSNVNTFDIKSVEIQLDGKNVGDGIDKKFTEGEFTFSLVINNNQDIDKDKPKIDWAIIDEIDLNCEINNEGKFKIGDTLGSLKVQVSVTSKNTLSKSVGVSIIAPSEFKLHSIEAVLPQNGLSFIEGQTFNTNGFKVAANFFNADNKSFQVYVTDCDYDSETKLDPKINSQMDITYAHMDVERMDTVYFVVKPKTLKSLQITKAPVKTNYIEGESFNGDGLEVTAHYEYIDEVLNYSDYIIGEEGQFLLPKTTAVSITYGKITVKQPISVARRTLQRIEILSPPKKLSYNLGQTFSAEGLKVQAYFEFCECDVTKDIVIKNSNNNEKLGYGDIITVSYKENGKTATKEIEITVREPYKEVRKIVFENPLDATLRWIYEYDTEDGISVLHNTEVVEGLFFDSANGVYIAPVGATITIMRVNPAIIDFIINGEPCGLLYPENSFEFDIESGGDDIIIEFKKLAEPKITIRFAGDEKEGNLALIYSPVWDSPMIDSDLGKISQVYPDTDKYYYEYTVTKKEFTTGNYEYVGTYIFSGLAAINIDEDMLVIVKKIERTKTQVVTINVMYGKVMMEVVIDKAGEIGLWILPQIAKVGYSLGFSESENGALFNSLDFFTWVGKANNGDFLYAVYTLNAEPQSGGIIGTWGIAVANGENTFMFYVEFKTNGTYIYKVVINGVENCRFEGVYTFNENIVTILSLESDMEYQLVSAEDFNEKPFELDNGKLNAPLFIIIGLTLESGQIKGLEKVL